MKEWDNKIEKDLHINSRDASHEKNAFLVNINLENPKIRRIMILTIERAKFKSEN